MRRDRQTPNLDTLDPVGVPLVFPARCELLLLRTEKAGRVRRAKGLAEIARSQIVRLHHVKVAVADQMAFARHLTPPTRSSC